MTVSILLSPIHVKSPALDGNTSGTANHIPYSSDNGDVTHVGDIGSGGELEIVPVNNMCNFQYWPVCEAWQQEMGLPFIRGNQYMLVSLVILMYNTSKSGWQN